MQMGRSAVRHLEQRLRIILTRFVTEVAMKEGCVLCYDPAQPPQTALQLWFQRRREKHGTRTGQALPLALYIYQDYIVAVYIGEDASRKIEEGIPRVLKMIYAIRLSTKV